MDDSVIGTVAHVLDNAAAPTRLLTETEDAAGDAVANRAVVTGTGPPEGMDVAAGSSEIGVNLTTVGVSSRALLNLNVVDTTAGIARTGNTRTKRNNRWFGDASRSSTAIRDRASNRIRSPTD